MRVAYINVDAGVPLFGHKGASNHVREFATALAHSGCRVTLFTSKIGEPAADLPCPIRVVGTVEALGDLPRVMRKEVSGLNCNEFLREALQTEHAAAPFDFVLERYSMWSYAGWEFADSTGIPFVLQVNSPLRLEQKRHRELHLEPVAELIERILFRSASTVTAVSREVADYVRGVSGRTRPTVVLPNGVDLDLFRGVARRQNKQGFTIGFVGSLKEWRGLEALLEAFASLAGEPPGYRLLIVGDGPLRSWIEAYARDRSIGNSVWLAGAVEKGRVPEFMAQMDVAVAPYPDLAGFYFSPLKVFEYMAAGCAIVASNVGQVSEILRDGVTALLARPGSVRDLAANIRRLQAQPELRAALARAAKEEAFRSHGWESRAARVIETLGKPRPSSTTQREGWPHAE